MKQGEYDFSFGTYWIWWKVKCIISQMNFTAVNSFLYFCIFFLKGMGIQRIEYLNMLLTKNLIFGHISYKPEVVVKAQYLN